MTMEMDEKTIKDDPDLRKKVFGLMHMGITLKEIANGITKDGKIIFEMHMIEQAHLMLENSDYFGIKRAK